MLGRELGGADDWKLLCFERMRILDMVHSWAIGTHKTYQSSLNHIRRFEVAFDIPILPSTTLESPPAGPDVPLMWCQESLSLRPGRRRRGDDVSHVPLSFTTIRNLRSAASQYLAWEMMITHPACSFLDARRRLLNLPCRPTDSLAYTLHATGMAARVGDEVNPSLPLLSRHIHYLDESLNHRYCTATNPTMKRQFALAGFANVLFWCGWLRSMEAFSTEWRDFSVVEPEDGPTVDLPAGMGVVSLRLQPETKSDRTRTADCIIAYCTSSGLCLGKWFHRARRCSGLDLNWSHHAGTIFCHPDGTPWTSLSYRNNFLYPSLLEQQAAGDPYLAPYKDCLKSKIWSLHCYRRGARNHVSRSGIYGANRYKRASLEQIYQHARWTRRRRSEAIDQQYIEWPICDRVRLTLYSQ